MRGLRPKILLLAPVLLVCSAASGQVGREEGGAPLPGMRREAGGAAILPADDGPLLLVARPRLSRIERLRVTADGGLEPLDPLDLSALEGRPGAVAVDPREPDAIYTLLSARAGKRYRSWVARIAAGSEAPPQVILALDDPAHLDGRRPFGLAVRGGHAWVSYDTSGIEERGARLRSGILRVALGEPASARVLPDSGRESRSRPVPCYDLAPMEREGALYLWGSSGRSWIYLLEPGTGRAIFTLRSPGPVAGLAESNGVLFVVCQDAEGDRVVRVRVAGPGSEPPEVGSRRVRRIRMELASEAVEDDPDGAVWHAYAEPSPRASQGHTGLRVGSGGGGRAEPFTYDPAGDAGARQAGLRLTFDGPFEKGRTITTTVETTVWTSASRGFVYPHRVSADGFDGPAGYLADDETVYAMKDRDAFDGFWRLVERETRAEYGEAASLEGPYWKARAVLEVIRERYDYGNVSDRRRGHFGFNPASAKLRLALDEEDGDERMSCSPSAFALDALLRAAGHPARWVGTSKHRSGWDRSGDGLFGADEAAIDEPFHRWAEVWLGPVYGWRRFDPTPPKEASERSQFDLAQRVAFGVSADDLVLVVGSGLVEPFYHQKDGRQRYNSVPRYRHPDRWRTRLHSRITWTNPCALVVEAPPLAPEGARTRVGWKPTGPWHLDPDATVSLAAEVMEADGEDGWKASGPRIPIARAVPVAKGEAWLEPGALPPGAYRILGTKDGDRATGGRSGVLVVSR